MEAPATTTVESGSAALAAGRWAAARAGFEAALEAQPDCPEALAGLAEALWWLGDTDGAVRCAERAYTGFRRRPDPAQAGMCAVSLYLHHRASLGNTAVARGWLARLSRLVDDFQLVPLTGWVALLRAHDARDPTVSEEWAREALRRASGAAAPDLELCALSQLGAALVQQGRLEEGTTMLDEAMAASLAGECDRLATVVFTTCSLVSACWQVTDAARVTQWVRAADTFSDSYGSPHLFTHCRVHHGATLFHTGDWVGAERELTAALRSGRSADPALYGEALGWLARLRLAQGRDEEAARLVEGYEDHAACVLPTAVLRLRGGDAQSAAHLARDRLRELTGDERDRPSAQHVGAALLLEHAELLEVLVEAELARGELARARAGAGRMVEQAARTGVEALVSRADRARALVLAGGGDTGGATAALRRAVTGFSGLGLPYEAAKARIALAELVADDEPRHAATLARRALATLEDLGSADADRAAALLRTLGEPTPRRRPAHATSDLTPREREVLRLLGEGLSNRELAQRMFLSRKTIEHHVHGVLTKLGLRSRSEAAAYAVRHDARDHATRASR